MRAALAVGASAAPQAPHRRRSRPQLHQPRRPRLRQPHRHRPRRRPAARRSRPTPAAEPQAAGPPVPRTFTVRRGHHLQRHQAGKAADFEAVMARVKEALGKSNDPKRKQQAAAGACSSPPKPGPGGTSVYLWFFDPPVKDEEYSVSTFWRRRFPKKRRTSGRSTSTASSDGQTTVEPAVDDDMCATPVVRSSGARRSALELQVDARVDPLHVRVPRRSAQA